MNNSVLLGINERINKHYRSSYSGVSDGKSTLATNIVNLCGKFPILSEEADLYPLESILGKELAEVVSRNIGKVSSITSNDSLEGNFAEMNNGPRLG